MKNEPQSHTLPIGQMQGEVEMDWNLIAESPDKEVIGDRDKKF